MVMDFTSKMCTLGLIFLVFLHLFQLQRGGDFPCVSSDNLAILAVKTCLGCDSLACHSCSKCVSLLYTLYCIVNRAVNTGLYFKWYCNVLKFTVKFTFAQFLIVYNELLCKVNTFLTCSVFNCTALITLYSRLWLHFSYLFIYFLAALSTSRSLVVGRSVRRSVGPSCL